MREKGDRTTVDVKRITVLNDSEFEKRKKNSAFGGAESLDVSSSASSRLVLTKIANDV